MASARVERMLEEIARLSSEEQAELVRDLPRVLQDGQQGRAGDDRGHLSIEAVRNAIEIRERIRQRLAAAKQSPGSIVADLDDIRDSRLEELLDSTSARDQA